jgi:hypothetical protein
LRLSAAHRDGGYRRPPLHARRAFYWIYNAVT